MFTTEKQYRQIERETESKRGKRDEVRQRNKIEKIRSREKGERVTRQFFEIGKRERWQWGKQYGR